MQLTKELIFTGLASVSLMIAYILNITGAVSKFKAWCLRGLATSLQPYHSISCPAKEIEANFEKKIDEIKQEIAEIKENNCWSNDVLAILLGNTLKWDSEKAIKAGWIKKELKGYIIKRYYPYWIKSYNGEVAMAVLTCINLPEVKGGVHTNFTFEDIYKN